VKLQTAWLTILIALVLTLTAVVSAQVLDFKYLQDLSPPKTSQPVFLPGDVFLTRNANEEENTSPGFWNHCAIYVGDGQIVEAQQDPGEVVDSKLNEFMDRYPEIRVLRVRVAPERYGVAAASRATQLVGTKYRLTASISKALRVVGRGDNCVSTVRRCYQYSWDNDPRWRIPDGVNEYPAFRLVWEKGGL